MKGNFHVRCEVGEKLEMTLKAYLSLYFLNSLNNIISGSQVDRVNAFRFLSKIGIGWVTGFILSVLFITSIFEKNIYQINSLFLGFIIASIPLIIKSERKTLVSSKRNIIFLLIGIIIVCTMTYFNPVKSTGQSFSLKTDNLSLLFILYIFISGMIAISAMVLPGISGSTILLIFGLYAPILAAVKQVIKLNFEYLPAIIIFMSGILVGVLITVRTVRRLLKNHRARTMYFIVGLMIGSTYAVVMGPISLEIPKPAMTFNTFDIAFFVIGCVLVPGLELIKKVLKNKNEELETV